MPRFAPLQCKGLVFSAQHSTQIFSLLKVLPLLPTVYFYFCNILGLCPWQLLNFSEFHFPHSITGVLTPCAMCPVVSTGSSIHGISPARILELGAVSSSRGSPWPKDRTCISCQYWQVDSLPLSHMESPVIPYRIMMRIKVVSLIWKGLSHSLCTQVPYEE